MRTFIFNQGGRKRRPHRRRETCAATLRQQAQGHRGRLPAWRWAGVWALASWGLIVGAASAEPDVAERLRDFVGAPARLVWIQQVDGDGDDPFCWGDQLVIMGLDTEDGLGKRAIVDEVANYHRPMMSPDGQHVVFSRLQTREAFVADWDEGEPRLIGEGYAATVWRDSATDITWVYIADNGKEGWDRHHASALHRVRIDDPSVRELVWDRAPFTIDNVQLSADGTRFCSQFTHPRAGYADVPNQSWTFLARGCWTSMAPDNSYRVWIFDGPHRNVTIHDPVEDTAWRVPINTAPGINDFEVYHPRWSNHAQFFLITGPYTKGRPGDNLISAGGPDVDVLVGRFSDDFRSVSDWLQVTDDGRGSFYPDLWIKRDAPTAPARVRPDTEVATRPYPSGLVLLWENANAANDAGGLRWDAESRGRAFGGPFAEMELDGGHFEITGTGTPAPDASQDTDALTLELLMTPRSDRVPHTAPVVANPGGAAPRWVLEQIHNRLQVRIPIAEERREWVVMLDKMEAGRTTHVLFTFERGRINVWRDGRRIGPEISVEGLRPWPLDSLLIGHDGTGTSTVWKGRVEDVAVYNRALTSEEIAARHAHSRDRAQERDAPVEFHVVARLQEALPPPDPESILPYRRALLTQAYTVESAPPESDLQSGDDIAVSHWTVLDQESAPRAFTDGARYRLHITPFEERPHLEAERQFFDIDYILLPHYYEITVATD